MGGHAATPLFIICTAGDIAIFYYHYVLSNFQRGMQYSADSLVCHCFVLYRLNVQHKSYADREDNIPAHLRRLNPLPSN